MDPKKDMLAELDLAGLNQNRAEAAEKHKEATARVQTANAAHFLLFWAGGCMMAVAASGIYRAFPKSDPMGVSLLTACVIFWLGMWVAAFIPMQSVRKRQDEARAATRRLKEIDDKIAFCHQVREEAKKVKVRRYAEAWDAKETP